MGYDCPERQLPKRFEGDISHIRGTVVFHDGIVMIAKRDREPPAAPRSQPSAVRWAAEACPGGIHYDISQRSKTMIEVTRGDAMHLYGSYGLKMDYTVRLSVRMSDPVNGEILKDALGKTQKRYPYLSLRIRRNAEKYCYEQNSSPVVLFHGDEQITLNSLESNYHIWAVSYQDDRIHLDISHGTSDGTGMYMVLSTLLYYYCAERYGLTDHTGIRTLEDPILAEESMDPADTVPPLPPAALNRPKMPDAFSLLKDAGLTPSEPVIYDIEIPEEEFVRFSKEHLASPGTMTCVLFSRAIDRLFPKRESPLMNSYIINARPMANDSKTIHNCVQTVKFEFSDEVRDRSFEEQCRIHREITAQSANEKKVMEQMAFSAGVAGMVLQKAKDIEAKKMTFGMSLDCGRKYFTYMVSYVGKWKYHQIEPWVKEFRTHVPIANDLLIEIAAMSGRIFLSVHQKFKEDIVLREVLKELEENHIPYVLHDPVPRDNAHMIEPEAVTE